MPDRVGQQLGNYRLVRLLGEGGFAEVYLSEHIHLGTEAAIKILTARLSSDEIEQFSNEARTIARLKHPHIIRVLDFGVDNGIPFLVMVTLPMAPYASIFPRARNCRPKLFSLMLCMLPPLYKVRRHRGGCQIGPWPYLATPSVSSHL